MRLYFLRHGLADRSAWSGSDFKRPLTPFGKERMARQAQHIAKLNLQLDAVISSPLVRAWQTAEIVAKPLGLEKKLLADKRLGNGFDIDVLAEMLSDYEIGQNLMLIGHESSFSETIADLIGGERIVCKKGSLARLDMFSLNPPAGELVWLIPPKAMIL